MSIMVNSIPKTASKLAALGVLISISSMVLVAPGRIRTPVAQIGLPLTAAKVNRCGRLGVKPGWALGYCAVGVVAQALVGLLEFATTVAGLAARVYWKVTLSR